MSYLGDVRLGDTLDCKFCTVGTTGAPTVLAGTPVVSAYVGNGLTQITAGVTLTVDFDAVVGLNNVRVVASGANGFAVATNVQLVITTGTVGGTSVVGYVVGSFSIEARLMADASIRAASFVAGAIDNAAFNVTETLTANPAAGGIVAASFGVGAIDNAAFNVTETLTANPATGGIVAASFGAGAIDAAAIATGAIDADAIALDAANEIMGSVSGTADSGSTTTVVDAERTEADTDYWKGSLIVFTSGTLNGQTRLVTAFNAATDTLTFAPALTVAAGTHTYRLFPAGRVDVELWDGSAVNALVSGRVDTSVGAMAADTITASAIAVGAIAADAFVAGAIDNAAFNVTETLTANPATGGIVAASFGAGAIDAAAIATGAIDADAIAADAIGASEFAQAAADKVFNASGATLAELAQAIPSATPRPDQAMMLLYMALRNNSASTSTERRVVNDAGTVIAKATMADDGTTFTQGELVSGP